MSGRYADRWTSASCYSYDGDGILIRTTLITGAVQRIAPVPFCAKSFTCLTKLQGKTYVRRDAPTFLLAAQCKRCVHSCT